MASFDFIEASVKGYEFVWDELSYIARVAGAVLFVKITCYLGVYVMHAQEDLLLRGLITLPSLAVDAIFVIGLIRYYLYREPIFIWGRALQPLATDAKITPYQGYYSKLQCYQGGIAMYCLINVILVAAAGVFYSLSTQEAPPIDPDSPRSGAAFLLSLVALLGMVGAMLFVFKLTWLYIPIAIGYPAKFFLSGFKGFRPAITLLATALVCLLPIMTLYGIVSLMTAGLFPEESAAEIILGFVLTSVGEILVISIQTVAMAYGIKKVLLG